MNLMMNMNKVEFIINGIKYNSQEIHKLILEHSPKHEDIWTGTVDYMTAETFIDIVHILRYKVQTPQLENINYEPDA